MTGERVGASVSAVRDSRTPRDLVGTVPPCHLCHHNITSTRRDRSPFPWSTVTVGRAWWSVAHQAGWGWTELVGRHRRQHQGRAPRRADDADPSSVGDDDGKMTALGAWPWAARRGAQRTSKAIETSNGSPPARPAISRRMACRLWAMIKTAQTCGWINTGLALHSSPSLRWSLISRIASSISQRRAYSWMRWAARRPRPAAYAPPDPDGLRQ